MRPTGTRVLSFVILAVTLGFLAGCQNAPPPPPPPPDFSDIACGTDELVTKLKADPSSLSGCSAASIRGADMPALVDAGVSKEQLLAVWSLDGATGFTPKQLKEAGITIAQMQSAGLTISQIHAGGVSVRDLLSAEVEIADLLSAGVSIADLRSAEVSIPDLRSAGVTIRELLVAGVTASELRTAGVTIADLRSAGVTTHELHSGGFTIADMQAAGLTISQIHAGGVSISDLQGAGLTLLQLYNGGVSTAQLRSAGATIAEMQSAGLSILEINAGGVSIAELHSGGVTVAQLLDTGLSIPQLYNGGIRGVPGNTLFNEVCNTPESGDPEFTDIDNGPMITSVSLELDTDDNTYAVVLEGKGAISVRWQSSVIVRSDMSNVIRYIRLLDSPGDMTTAGDVVGLYVRDEGTTVVSTLSIPLGDVFSNLTVTIADSASITANINLCPGG